MALEEIKSQLGGKWKLDRSENFDEFLKELGKSNYIYNIGAAVYQWCEFKSRRGKNTNLTAQRPNSNTVWFNFQTYI